MLKEEIKKIYRFLFIGGSSTLIDFLIYFFLSKDMDINLAKSISMVISCIFAFLCNRSWTFQIKGKVRCGHLVKYILAQGINIAANVSANRIVLNISNKKLLAYILATCAGMTCNFLLQRFFVFAKKGEEK